jgi:putative transposase
MELVANVRIQMPRLGTRKLYHLLSTDLKSLGVGRDRLFQILKSNHMLINPKKQYHITTDSRHRFRKHKNLIENMIIDRPEQVWVSDITYIGTRKNPMYLFLVTDAYSKKIMGYNVSDSLASTGAVSALKEALKHRNNQKKPLIHHSDRGLQYCCNEYQKLLNKYDIKCSMTEKYDPYQNAIAERVNGILKHEFINEIKISDKELWGLFIEDTIKIYNQKRPHYSCYMLTPNQMHKQSKMKMRTYKKSENEINFILT